MPDDARRISEVRTEGYQTDYKKTIVDLSSLTSGEFANIAKVVSVMKIKSQAQKGPGGDSAGPKMLTDLMTDLEIASFAETKLPKKSHTSTPPFIAKIRQVSKGQGCEERFKELLNSAGPEGWEKEWDAPVEGRSRALNSANVFNVDHMVLFAMYCKASQFSLSDAMRFAESLALFSMMRNVGRDAQKAFWKSHSQFKHIRAFMHESFEGIHDSPFKLTFTRCLRAATCLMPVASDLAPLYVQDKDVGLKMIAKICAFQEMSGDITTEQNTTSTSEHLIHQLLLSGMDGTLHLNKNILRGSALYKVSFFYDKEAIHVETNKVQKMTVKLCQEFKAKSSKITKAVAEEKDMISEEFFKRIMGNAPFPEFSGKKDLKKEDKWSFELQPLTQEDMSNALDSLDEGFESMTERFSSFKSLMND